MNAQTKTIKHVYANADGTTTTQLYSWRDAKRALAHHILQTKKGNYSVLLTVRKPVRAL